MHDIAELDDHEGLITDTHKIFAFLAHLTKMSHDIHAHVQENVNDVDMWLSAPTPGQTVYDLKPQFTRPYVIEFIFAIFPTTSASVVIQIGSRFMNLATASAGFFSLDTRMQVEPEDIVRMTISPAGFGHFEVMGRTTRRVVDRA